MSDLEYQRLASRVLHPRSDVPLVALSRFETFMQDNPQYSTQAKDVYCRLLAQMKDTITRTREGSSTTTPTILSADDLMRVSLSLTNIGTTKRDQWGSSASRHISENWKLICWWLSLLCGMCSLPKGRSTILEQIDPYGFSMCVNRFFALSLVIEDLPKAEIIPVIFQAWIVEVDLWNDGNFDQATPREHVALCAKHSGSIALLSSEANLQEGSPVRDAIIAAVTQAAEPLARAGCKYLQLWPNSFERSQINAEAYTTVSNTILMALSSLSRFEEVRAVLDFQSSTSQAISLWATVTSQPFNSRTADGIYKAIFTCGYHLLRAATSPMWKKRVAQAVESGVLTCYLRSLPWWRWGLSQPSLREAAEADNLHITNYASDCLASNMIHLPILRAMEKTFPSIQDLVHQFNRPALQTGEKIEDPWFTMIDAFNEINAVKESQAHQQLVCARSMCNQTAVSECCGCRVARYCSRTCQKLDWKHGNHRRTCLKLQNVPPDMSGRQAVFLQEIVNQVLSKHDVEVRQLMRHEPTMHLDMRRFPPDFAAGPRTSDTAHAHNSRDGPSFEIFTTFRNGPGLLEATGLVSTSTLSVMGFLRFALA